MLPLRSRTSWRLRALTVTCLPRDWTWAGIYHFANNRRRGHNLPEGHHGELAKNLGYRARPPVPTPSGPPGRGRVTILREPVTEPWGLTEMWIQDPDGIRIVLVEVPAGHPLRRDPRPAPPPG